MEVSKLGKSLSWPGKEQCEQMEGCQGATVGSALGSLLESNCV